MAISFANITNKVINWIKTNGNREITAEQLNEILIDFINALIEEVPEAKIPFLNSNGYFEGGPKYDTSNNKLSVDALALEFGAALVNQIYNSGAFTGSASRSLITKEYHDKFHKNNLWADISVTTTLDPVNLKAGDEVDDQTLVDGQVMLVIDPEDADNNGLYMVGTENSVLLDTYSNDFATAVIVFEPKEGAPNEYVIETDNSVREGTIAADLPKYVKIVSQCLVLNN